MMNLIRRCARFVLVICIFVLTSARIEAVMLAPACFPFSLSLFEDQQNCALIQGKVIDAEGKPTKEKEVVAATVKVLHVYSGPKELLGTKFVDLAVGAHSDNDADRYASPEYKVDEIGLWILVRNKEGWEASPFGRVRNYGGEQDRESFQRKVELAQTIERATKWTAERRYSFAKELCEYQVREFASLGFSHVMMYLDDKAKGADARAFLYELAKNPRVNLQTLCDVDYFLRDTVGYRKTKDIAKQWLASDARGHFLTRLKSPTTKEETAVALGYVMYELDGAEHVELLGEFLRNPRIARKTRLEIIVTLASRACYKREVDPSFDALVSMVKRVDDDSVVRLEAARWLGKLGEYTEGDTNKGKIERLRLPLSEKQMELLQSLLKDEKDQNVSDVLRVATSNPGLKP